MEQIIIVKHFTMNYSHLKCTVSGGLVAMQRCNASILNLLVMQ